MGTFAQRKTMTDEQEKIKTWLLPPLYFGRGYILDFYSYHFLSSLNSGISPYPARVRASPMSPASVQYSCLKRFMKRHWESSNLAVPWSYQWPEKGTTAPVFPSNPHIHTCKHIHGEACSNSRIFHPFGWNSNPTPPKQPEFETSPCRQSLQNGSHSQGLTAKLGTTANAVWQEGGMLLSSPLWSSVNQQCQSSWRW